MTDIYQWINSNQPIIISSTNLLLVIVTIIYATLTYHILSATKMQFKVVSNPIIGLKIADITISKVYGPQRRSLKVELEMINLGNGPAIDIQIDGELIYSHTNIKGHKSIPSYLEPRRIPFLTVNESLKPDFKTHVYWGNTSILHLFDDFRENDRLNTHRLATDPTQKSFKSSRIKILVNYRNNLDQLFESEYETYIDYPLDLDTASTDGVVVKKFNIPKDNEEAHIRHHPIIRPKFRAKIIKDIELEKRLKEFEKKRKLGGW